MILTHLQVGTPQPHTSEESATTPRMDWTSGIAKAAVSGRVALAPTNLAGDGQADLRAHGGPEKAVCVYPSEHYDFWSTDLGMHAGPGGFGENFTVAGMLETEICVGDTFRIGSAIVQVSQPRQPCWKLARWRGCPTLPTRMQETGRTGWYLRVLTSGDVQAGDRFELIARPAPARTLADANRAMHQGQADWQAAATWADCEWLSTNWRATFRRRAENRQVEDTRPRLQGPVGQTH